MDKVGNVLISRRSRFSRATGARCAWTLHLARRAVPVVVRCAPLGAPRPSGAAYGIPMETQGGAAVTGGPLSGVFRPSFAVLGRRPTSGGIRCASVPPVPAGGSTRVSSGDIPRGATGIHRRLIRGLPHPCGQWSHTAPPGHRSGHGRVRQAPSSVVEPKALHSAE